MPPEIEDSQTPQECKGAKMWPRKRPNFELVAHFAGHKIIAAYSYEREELIRLGEKYCAALPNLSCTVSKVRPAKRRLASVLQFAVLVHKAAQPPQTFTVEKRALPKSLANWNRDDI